MAYTFKPGRYDFGSKEADKVKLTHETDYMDYFVMVNETPVQLLNDYYQLTGNPVLLPKSGFYEGHLNAYNRDYWKEEDGSGYGVVKFEDGKYYKESQKDNGGIRESLNGELEGNYQFSARAVIDRYKNNDMPLGWLLPNDGYGAGYGQTSTLDGNVANLKAFGDYARKNGVEIGLWTQSDLHPIDSISALLQRDIVKEIRDAGVRVLKTDVAWVGAGYSFGLNGISDVANLMPQYGNNARPFIITLDGWAGTQRYGGVWSGDQTGGKWEYIRFHIPTYIRSGLAGQPNISSDMDGIFGGKNVPVNVRDFQWKTFTPMQLNMDGWGSNQKYPHALGEPAASINRVYLKMKSMFMPYTYSIAKEAVDGKPMVRAIFLEDPNKYTLGKATQYEFLYGSSVLVAPIYQETTADEEGNMVSFIQSNYMEFGSGVVIPGTAISLQNRGANFSLDEGSDNCLQGGKRSYHTIIPGFLAKDGQPIGPFGVMGGFMQPQGHVQVVVNTVDYGMNPQDCLDAPRFQWQGGKKIQLEQEVPAAVAEELRRRGHEVEVVSDRIAMGRGQIIWRRRDGTLVGGTEPRSDGAIAVW